MIPKTIHYCWFGRNPKPKLAEKCIKSWKKYCPRYEIIEWNEDNFDIFSAPVYVQQAYEAKKWAFVTDYVRLWAMTKFGGIYMDTDVELIKPLDKFLSHKAFSGFEDGVNIPTGIMASEKEFPLFEEFLHYYDNASFKNADGSLDCKTNVAIMTESCLSHGLVQNNQYQVIEEFAIYPREVFCPYDCATGRIAKAKETVAIHWFAASWLTEKQRAGRMNVIKEVQKNDRIHNLTHLPNRLLRKMVGDKNYEKLKHHMKKYE